jgi:hypothetical protein
LLVAPLTWVCMGGSGTERNDKISAKSERNMCVCVCGK